MTSYVLDIPRPIAVHYFDGAVYKLLAVARGFLRIEIVTPFARGFAAWK